MADRVLRQIKAIDQDVVVLSFSFAPQGSSQPTGITGRGVATITRTGAGDFLVTLQDVWPALLGAKMSIQMSTATDISPQLGDVDLSAKTLVVRTIVAATETDIAADANNRVFVELTMRNGSVV